MSRAAAEGTTKSLLADARVSKQLLLENLPLACGGQNFQVNEHQ
jgi:hypothetical protein